MRVGGVVLAVAGAALTVAGVVGPAVPDANVFSQNLAVTIVHGVTALVGLAIALRAHARVRRDKPQVPRTRRVIIEASQGACVGPRRVPHRHGRLRAHRDRLRRTRRAVPLPRRRPPPPRLLRSMQEAEPTGEHVEGGDEVHVVADVEGKRREGDAWISVDDGRAPCVGVGRAERLPRRAGGLAAATAAPGSRCGCTPSGPTAPGSARGSNRRWRRSSSRSKARRPIRPDRHNPGPPPVTSGTNATFARRSARPAR